MDLQRTKSMKKTLNNLEIEKKPSEVTNLICLNIMGLIPMEPLVLFIGFLGQWVPKFPL